MIHVAKPRSDHTTPTSKQICWCGLPLINLDDDDRWMSDHQLEDPVFIDRITLNRIQICQGCINVRRLCG